MKLRLNRWISLLLLAATAFAQASVSVANCPMERGQLWQTIARSAEPPCESGTHVNKGAPRNANRCMAHSTADLQLAGVAVAIARIPADAPVLVLPLAELRSALQSRLDDPPTGAPPRRILLHCFLI